MTALSPRLSTFLTYTPTLTSEAKLSPCGTYRYELRRAWSDAPPATFIMLNPSTADGRIDDPTIRRCVGFARAWGNGGIVVANLFAFRATDPRELAHAADPVGPENDAVLARLLAAPGRLVVAWGAGTRLFDRRASVVANLIREHGRAASCLGRTKHGDPRHPLFVRADTPLVVWP